MEKTQSLYKPLISGIKINIISVICHRNTYSQIKIRSFISKVALIPINEEIKG